MDGLHGRLKPKLIQFEHYTHNTIVFDKQFQFIFRNWKLCSLHANFHEVTETSGNFVKSYYKNRHVRFLQGLKLCSCQVVCMCVGSQFSLLDCYVKSTNCVQKLLYWLIYEYNGLTISLILTEWRKVIKSKLILSSKPFQPAEEYQFYLY